MIGWGIVFLYIAAGMTLWPAMFRWFLNDISLGARPNVGYVIESAAIATIAYLVWPLVAVYRYVFKPVARWWIETEYPEKPVEDRDMYGRPRNR